MPRRLCLEFDGAVFDVMTRTAWRHEPPGVRVGIQFLYVRITQLGIRKNLKQNLTPSFSPSFSNLTPSFSSPFLRMKTIPDTLSALDTFPAPLIPAQPPTAATRRRRRNQPTRPTSTAPPPIV